MVAAGTLTAMKLAMDTRAMTTEAEAKAEGMATVAAVETFTAMSDGSSGKSDSNGGNRGSGSRQR